MRGSCGPDQHCSIVLVGFVALLGARLTECIEWCGMGARSRERVTELYAIVGAGGFGREVMAMAIARANANSNGCELVFVVEDVEGKSLVNNRRLLSKQAFLDHSGPRYFSLAISDSGSRKRIAEELIAHGCVPFQVTSPDSVVVSPCDLGEGAILANFTIINANARIGRFFQANVYAHVSHDCVIGDYVTLAPKASVNGAVIIEDFAYVGAGAIIKQGTPAKPMTIGRGATIGMGAVVTRSVPAGATVVGNPARSIVRA